MARTFTHLPHYEEIFVAAERVRHCWGLCVEVVTNIIPGLNDDEETLEGIAHWLATRLGPDTPGI